MTQLETGESSQSQPNQVVLDMLNGMWLAFALQAAAHFDLATRIADTSLSTTDLARQTMTQEDEIYRLLRYLATQGIFTETAPHVFKNTALSACLRSDRPGSVYGIARMMGSERYRLEWGQLEETIRTGVPAVERLYQQTLYDYFVEHPDEGAIFDRAMEGFSSVVNEAIATGYDFSRFRRIVDVGGGNGSLLSAILSRYSTIGGILFDLPAVIERIKQVRNVSFELIAGDFFQGPIPSGADAYLMKAILHNWSDEQCRTILRNCRQAMHSSSVLLVCELSVPTGNLGAFAKGLDLVMMLEQQGRERTRAEFEELFASAGLYLRHAIPTNSAQTIFEGVIA